MAQTPEGKVKKKVKELLESKGVWYFMSVQTGWGVHGVPDFLCCVPSVMGTGFFLGIETKAPGQHDNLSSWQVIQRGRIETAGGEYLVVSDIKQLEDWFNDYEV